MKNILISMCVLSCFCMAQFEAGSKTFSGGASYSSSNSGVEGEDAVATITLNPSAGYFLMDNLAGKFDLNWSKVGEGDATTTYGVGATYHMGMMYGGGMYNGSTAEGAEGSLTFRGGYLMPCGDGGSTFLDLYGSYHMGMGDDKSSTMTFGVGVATFF